MITAIGGFISFIVNLFLWFALTVIGGPNLRSTSWIAIVAVALAPISPIGINFDRATSIRLDATAHADLLGPLSSAEKTRFREILFGVMQDPDYMSPQVHGEFWLLLEKAALRPSDLKQLRDLLIGEATVYNRLLYEDAMWALKTGRPFKSIQREQYEKRLLALGLITEWRIRENESLIAKIAAREPVAYQGTTIVFNEDLVKGILDNIDKVMRRVDSLFSRPK